MVLLSTYPDNPAEASMRDLLNKGARHHAPPLRLRGLAGRLLMATIAVCVASVAPVHAAEIKGFDEVILEGNIEAGDFDKLRNCVKENQTKSIYLASPGGNVAEAIKIGRLVRALDLETVVPVKEPSSDLRQ